jgi:hypothetical protein
MYTTTENMFAVLVSTQSVAFSYTDFHTTLYFVNQRNYKTQAMQALVLTHTRYFYGLNVIILPLIVYKEGLGYLSVCAIASRSSPPSHVCVCEGQRSSELSCVHCRFSCKVPVTVGWFQPKLTWLDSFLFREIPWHKISWKSVQPFLSSYMRTGRRSVKMGLVGAPSGCGRN